MKTYIGVCPHAAGGFAAEYVEVQAETPQEALPLVWQQIVGSRYVSRIIDKETRVEVWTEGLGFRVP